MKRILVVVDMQYDFTVGRLGNKECRSVIDKVVDVINNRDYEYIILTKDTHQSNYLDTQEGRKLPVIHCVENTPGWMIHEDVYKAVQSRLNPENTVTLNKSSFGSIELIDVLNKIISKIDTDNNERTEIEFVGVCTGICVISNVLITKAAFPEHKVSVIEEACACVTPETHKTAIEAMRTCQVDII